MDSSTNIIVVCNAGVEETRQELIECVGGNEEHLQSQQILKFEPKLERQRNIMIGAYDEMKRDSFPEL